MNKLLLSIVMTFAIALSALADGPVTILVNWSGNLEIVEVAQVAQPGDQLIGTVIIGGLRYGVYDLNSQGYGLQPIYLVLES